MTGKNECEVSPDVFWWNEAKRESVKQPRITAITDDQLQKTVWKPLTVKDDWISDNEAKLYNNCEMKQNIELRAAKNLYRVNYRVALWISAPSRWLY